MDRAEVQLMKTIQKLLFALSLLVSAGSLFAGLQLSSDGKTPYVIVKSADATEAESFAAAELSTYLERVTGAKFKIVDEKTKISTPAIYVGNTAFAQKNEVISSKLAPEEWVIKQKGKDLILGGGRPRGVLYGAYDFLENYAGCRWYDLRTEKVPSNPNLTLPDTMEVRKKPFVRLRSYYWVNALLPEFSLWAVRNKFNALIAHSAKYGFREQFGSPSFAHTYYEYSKDFPAECFSMNEKGVREKARTPSGPGQLCLSNPLTLKLCTEKLLSYIRNDRKKTLEKKEPSPIYYMFFTNDNSEFCRCPKCHAAAEKLGTSGITLDFVNQLADAVAKDYPDVVVVMDAYRSTMEPPKGPMSARKNVMVLIAALGVEFEGPLGRDVLRPLTASQNQYYVRHLDAWKKYSARIGIWDYFRMFGQGFAAPASSIGTRSELFKKHHSLGTEYMFIEGEIYPGMTDHFLDLRNWLTGKLLVNPQADAAALTEDFMNGYYGKAAPAMKEYLAYVEKRMTEENDNLATKHPSKWAYLDDAFYRHADALLSKAEALVKEEKNDLSNVRQERFLLESSMLNMFDSYPKNPLNLTKKELADRVIRGEQAFWEKYHGKAYWAANTKKHTERYLAMLERPPLPKEFLGKTVASDLCWSDISSLMKTAVNDKDAAGGKALCIQVSDMNPKTFHDKDFQFGVYAPTYSKKQLINRTIPKSDLPQDEKYHFYPIGNTLIPDSQTFLWLHWSWHLQPKLGHLFDPAELETKFDIYASIKFEGPAYVKGSKKENNVFLDRVIVVRVAK